MDRSLGRWKGWLWAGLALIVGGILLWTGSYLYQTSQLIDHNQLTIHADWEELGTYRLEAGDYTVWVEDYYSGPAGGGAFDVWATEVNVGLEELGTPEEASTRTIDGVECEEAGRFEGLVEGEWRFDVMNGRSASTTRDVHVFITREDNPGPAIVFALGTVCVFFGFVMMGLWALQRRKEMAEEGRLGRLEY